jgi:hypothetical protein
MALLRDAVAACTPSYRMNYEILGNAEPALHTHVWPRFLDEPEEFKRGGVWRYPPEMRNSMGSPSKLMLRFKLHSETSSSALSRADRRCGASPSCGRGWHSRHGCRYGRGNGQGRDATLFDAGGVILVRQICVRSRLGGSSGDLHLIDNARQNFDANDAVACDVAWPWGGRWSERMAAGAPRAEQPDRECVTLVRTWEVGHGAGDSLRR